MSVHRSQSSLSYCGDSDYIAGEAANLDSLHAAGEDFSSLISFSEAAKLLPKNRRPSYTTFWRWATRGIRGVKLETILVGGRRYTTAKAMQAFVEALSQQRGEPQRGTSTKRRTSASSAEQELKEFGIL